MLLVAYVSQDWRPALRTIGEDVMESCGENIDPIARMLLLCRGHMVRSGRTTGHSTRTSRASMA